MTDQTTPTPSLMDFLKQMFSPATLAAFRYALAAIAPMLGLFGYTGLSPDRIDQIVAYAKTFGIAAAAIATLAGILIPLTVAIFGVLSATIKKQVARMKELAKDPTAAGVEAQKALVDATSMIAANPTAFSQSASAVKTLVDATIALPQVQTIVTDAKTAAASPSESVVSAESHDVVKVAG